MPSLPEAPQPAATALRAFREGWRRVLRAPALSASALAATFLMALPLALLLQRSLETHLGSSLEAGRAADGWNEDWAAEYGAQAQGLGRTFTHEFLGFGGTLAIISDMADAEAPNPALAGAAAVSVALWIFLSGGFLDRLARGRPVRAAHFFSMCGAYVVRFIRLAVFVGAAYWALFRWLHPYLFGTLYHQLARDMTAERSGMVLRLALYGVFLLALALVNLVADFAKVRAVVEDRRSMVGAIGASLRFIRRRAFRVTGLYLLNAIAFVAILWLWMMVAPSATAPTWMAFLLAEVYLLLRVWAKLAFMASEIVIFQDALAHAQYAATPEPLWPDSPAAEAIDNLRRGNSGPT